jgi:U6 snRNA-associated Sm-like protein LSm1
VRGENVLLLGEIDLDSEDVVPAPWKAGEVAAVQELVRAEEAKRKRRERRKVGEMHKRGFEGDLIGEAIL